MKKTILVISLSAAFLLPVLLSYSALGDSRSTTITVLQGDKDCFGFGGVCADGDVFLGPFDNREPDDPLGTDQFDTAAVLEGPSFTFDIDLAGLRPTYASIEVFTAGLSNDCGWFAFSGEYYGNIWTCGSAPGGAEDTAESYVTRVPVGALGQTNILDMSPDINGFLPGIDESDEVVFDYAELTVLGVVNPEPVIWRFGGVVTYIDESPACPFNPGCFPGEYQVGDAWTAVVTFDKATPENPDTVSDVERSIFDNPILSVDFWVGLEHAGVGAPDGVDQYWPRVGPYVYFLQPDPHYISLRDGSEDSIALSYGNGGGPGLRWFSLVLSDSDGFPADLLDSDQLQTNPPDIQNATQGTVAFGYGTFSWPAGFASLDGTITSIELVIDDTDPLDEDGIATTNDNCPTVANPQQEDFDNDGIGDACDSDDDNDGVPDEDDAFPLDPNESVDTDGDGTGNNADPDDDNDGIIDSLDDQPLVSNNACTDRDGDNASLGVSVVAELTCAAQGFIDVQGVTQVMGPPAYLNLIAPAVGF